MKTRPTAEQRDQALNAWLRRDHRAAKGLGFLATADEITFDMPEARALSVGTTTAGGNLVRPLALADGIALAMSAAPMRQVAEVVTVDPPALTFRWPTGDDLEGVVVSEAADPGNLDSAFSAVDFVPVKFSSLRVVMSAELLQDSPLLQQTLGLLLGKRIRKRMNHTFTNNLIAELTAIAGNAARGVLAAGAAVITGDELLSLYFSVDATHRASPGVGWLMADATLQAIMKLKGTGSGDYLFEFPEAAGDPPLLLGAPVYPNPHMPAMTTGNASVVFGDLSAFKVVDWGGTRLREETERLALTDQVAYTLYARSSGHLVDPGDHPIKYLQQA